MSDLFVTGACGHRLHWEECPGCNGWGHVTDDEGEGECPACDGGGGAWVCPECDQVRRPVEP